MVNGVLVYGYGRSPWKSETRGRDVRVEEWTIGRDGNVQRGRTGRVWGIATIYRGWAFIKTAFGIIAFRERRVPKMAFPRDRPWSCAPPKIYIMPPWDLSSLRVPSQSGPLWPAINMLFTLYKSLTCSYIALAWLLPVDQKWLGHFGLCLLRIIQEICMQRCFPSNHAPYRLSLPPSLSTLYTTALFFHAQRVWNRMIRMCLARFNHAIMSTLVLPRT